MRSEAQRDPMATTLVAFLALTLLVGMVLLGSVGYRLFANWSRPPAEPPVAPKVLSVPSPQARAAQVPTATLGPSSTATLAPTATPRSCREGIRDGGFEAGEGWTIVQTAYLAGYVNQPAEYVANPVRSGERALRLGIAEGENVYSYSAVDQPVNIPLDVTSARLSMWLLPVSEAPDEDLQYVLLLKEGGGYDVLMWERRQAQSWQRREFSLDVYRGQEVVVHIGVRNDGGQGLTSMYVDDVSLALCYGATPTPHPATE